MGNDCLALLHTPQTLTLCSASSAYCRKCLIPGELQGWSCLLLVWYTHLSYTRELLSNLAARHPCLSALHTCAPGCLGLLKSFLLSRRQPLSFPEHHRGLHLQLHTHIPPTSLWHKSQPGSEALGSLPTGAPGHSQAEVLGASGSGSKSLSSEVPALLPLVLGLIYYTRSTLGRR